MTANVLDELRYLLENGDFYNADYKRFEVLIPRIAALVEAARPFDGRIPRGRIADDAAIQIVVGAGELRAIESALRGVGQ